MVLLIVITDIHFILLYQNFLLSYDWPDGCVYNANDYHYKFGYDAIVYALRDAQSKGYRYITISHARNMTYGWDLDPGMGYIRKEVLELPENPPVNETKHYIVTCTSPKRLWGIPVKRIGYYSVYPQGDY
jgi:hypothetical protein